MGITGSSFSLVLFSCVLVYSAQLLANCAILTGLGQQDYPLASVYKNSDLGTYRVRLPQLADSASGTPIETRIERGGVALFKHYRIPLSAKGEPLRVAWARTDRDFRMGDILNEHQVQLDNPKVLWPYANLEFISKNIDPKFRYRFHIKYFKQ